MGVLSSVASAVSSGSTSSPTYLTGYTSVPWYRFSLRKFVLLLLPTLSILGAFGTWVLGYRNGTFKQIFDVLAQDAPFLPGSADPLVRNYTRVGFVDHQLQVLVTFFAPVVDPKNPELTLFSVLGLGQFGAAWTLLMLESMRMGNKGKVVSYIGLVGILIQNISFTITVPIYLATHLLTSSIAKPFPGNHANSVLLVSSLDLRILPLSVILGYIIPSILMALPSPSIVSPAAHQRYIASWQVFPLWVIGAHWSVKFFLGRIFKDDINKHPPASLGATYLSTAKHLYRFVLALCMLTYIPVIAIILIPSWVFPDISPTFTLISQCGFLEVFVPYFPLLSHQVPTLAAGALNFLQWDLYVGSMSFLLWAILLYRNATTEKAVVDPNTSLPIYRELLLGEKSQDGMLRRKLIWKISIWTLLSGPMGALSILLWERDMIVRHKLKQGV